MTRRTAAALLLLVSLGCSRSSDRAASGSDSTAGAKTPTDSVATERDWRIEPGRRVGPLSAEGGLSSLVAAYGGAEVRQARVELGEGESAPGTLVFPDQPDRRIQFLWSDSVRMQRPARAILRGERSRWSLPGSVSLGTSLKELREKNGRPFTLAGFGWDYAGVVVSWSGGALDTLLAPGIKVYLEPRIEDRSGSDYARVVGDRDYSSENPAMRALNPRIYQIFVDFEEGPR